MKPITTTFLLILLNAANAHAATRSVCDRTPQIRDALVQALDKPCDQIREADLLQVKAIRVPRTGLTAVKLGDFSGLTRLDTLNVKRNAISELPRGIFAELSSLRVLVILGNNLHELPEDFTAANPKLEKIHMFGNAFTTISPRVLRNLKSLPKLNLLDVGRELDEETQSALWTAFPREDEHVTLLFN